jgi:beta-glucosidase
LAGFQRIELQPGEHRSVTLTVDPRVIASFDEARKAWVIDSGTYTLYVAKSANEWVQSTPVQIRGYSLPARYQGGT